MTSKHIGLIYTGGTVGMARTADGYALMQDFAGVLSRRLAEAGANALHSPLPRYTLHEYAQPIDSSNATPEDWCRIGRDIADRYHDHDGFVILHGTDTMAYTAAALSFMLQGLQKPVILTGSQIPLGEARSDALQNVISALQIASSDEVCEVAIYFNQRLLRGNRATKVSAERLQAFDSPHYPWLAEAGIAVQLNRAALLPRAPRERFSLAPYGQGRIIPVRFAPGLPARAVQAMIDLAPQALILQCYGTGNVPDRDPALLDLLARAGGQGVLMVACSQSLHGAVALNTYALGARLAQAGVIGAGDMTFEAVYAKLHHLFALGLPPDAVRMEFVRDLCGELTLQG